MSWPIFVSGWPWLGRNFKTKYYCIFVYDMYNYQLFILWLSWNFHATKKQSNRQQRNKCYCYFALQTPLHYAASSTHGGICLEILVTEGATTKLQVNRHKLVTHKVVWQNIHVAFEVLEHCDLSKITANNSGDIWNKLLYIQKEENMLWSVEFW